MEIPRSRTGITRSTSASRLFNTKNEQNDTMINRQQAKSRTAPIDVPSLLGCFTTNDHFISHSRTRSAEQSETSSVDQFDSDQSASNLSCDAAGSFLPKRCRRPGPTGVEKTHQSLKVQHAQVQPAQLEESANFNFENSLQQPLHDYGTGASTFTSQAVPSTAGVPIHAFPLKFTMPYPRSPCRVPVTASHTILDSLEKYNVASSDESLSSSVIMSQNSSPELHALTQLFQSNPFTLNTHSGSSTFHRTRSPSVCSLPALNSSMPSGKMPPSELLSGRSSPTFPSSFGGVRPVSQLSTPPMSSRLILSHMKSNCDQQSTPIKSFMVSASASPKPSFERLSSRLSNSSPKSKKRSMPQTPTPKRQRYAGSPDVCLFLYQLPSPVFMKDFQILDFIGSGSFAEVNRVSCLLPERLNCLYALKQAVHPFDSLRHEKNAVRHVGLLNTLLNHTDGWHPHIITTYSVWIELGRLMVLMECCISDLTNWFSSSCKEKDIWIFLRDISSAARHLHSLNICHMDIKPHNIYLDSAGCFKLGDLQSLVTSNDWWPESDELGDGSFLAPEALTQKITPACDIYSLGATAMSILTDSILERDDNGRLIPDFSKALVKPSDELQNLLLSMLRDKPSERPTAAEVYNISIERIRTDT